jgi:hypothetical protein
MEPNTEQPLSLPNLNTYSNNYQIKIKKAVNIQLHAQGFKPFQILR